MAAASGPSFGAPDASGVAPVFESWFDADAAEEALRDTDRYRIGRMLWARLGAKKSSTGRRHAAIRLEL